MSADRYVPNGAPITPYEREVMENLVEECCEVGQAACKLLRFGRDNRPDSGLLNTTHLGLECGDLVHMVMTAANARLIFTSDVFDGMLRKRERFARYRQYDPDGGGHGQQAQPSQAQPPENQKGGDYVRDAVTGPCGASASDGGQQAGQTGDESIASGEKANAVEDDASYRMRIGRFLAHYPVANTAKLMTLIQIMTGADLDSIGNDMGLYRHGVDAVPKSIAS